MTQLKDENYFLVLGLIFGLFLIFLQPPFQSPDENNHFLRSYSLALGELSPERDTVNIGIGCYMNSSVPQFINEFNGFQGNISKKFSYNSMYFKSEIPENLHIDNNKVFVSVPLMTESPIGYLPQSLGMFILRLISYISPFSLINFIWIGRLFNLLFYLTIGFLALKIAPFYKKGIIALLLMPMSLSLASSLNRDALTIAISILFLTLILKYAYDEKNELLSKNDLVLIAICLCLLLHLKTVYWGLGFMMFILPHSKFKNKKKAFTIFAVMSVTVLIYVPWILFKKYDVEGVNLSPAPLNSTIKSLSDQQFDFIKSNPIKYIVIYFKSSYHSLHFWHQSFIGNLGNLDTNFPRLFYVLHSAFLLCSFWYANNIKIHIPLSKRILSLIIFFVIFFIIQTVMYIGWTPYFYGIGGNDITGYQGRYFIPFIFLLFYSFHHNAPDGVHKIRQRLVGNYNILWYGFLTFSLVLTVLIVVLRFIVN